ncbi:MAG: Hpt domain-containing protein [Desulfovibrio sp.]|uniref:Hpt domain-containing protein n=1 Tax=Desulfovibrio sp. TaxID=885 RepID=UPI00258E1A28|nr:Hpt domain-containing protein [Desulfovibrio sp.]MCD7983432.1 Hpt domain-containing protein [Desulfovibrio sp.]
MDQDRKTRLEEVGLMLDVALERFMGNESMLERYLQKFLTEESYARLLAAIAAGERETAAMAAHSLKSVCGTLGCESMRTLVLRQEQHIRNGEWDEAVTMMTEIANSYNRICAVLRA